MTKKKMYEEVKAVFLIRMKVFCQKVYSIWVRKKNLEKRLLPLILKYAFYYKWQEIAKPQKR
jgi:hypothetical protein